MVVLVAQSSTRRSRSTSGNGVFFVFLVVLVLVFVFLAVVVLLVVPLFRTTYVTTTALDQVSVNAFIVGDPLKKWVIFLLWPMVPISGAPPSNGMASQGQKLAAKLPQHSSSRKMGAPNAFKRQVRHVRSVSRLEVLPGRCPVPIADFTVNVTVPQMPQFHHRMREVKGTL